MPCCEDDGPFDASGGCIKVRDRRVSTAPTEIKGHTSCLRGRQRAIVGLLACNIVQASWILVAAQLAGAQSSLAAPAECLDISVLASQHHPAR